MTFKLMGETALTKLVRFTELFTGLSLNESTKTILMPCAMIEIVYKSIALIILIKHRANLNELG